MGGVSLIIMLITIIITQGRSPSSSVGVASRLQAGRSGDRIPVGLRDFSLLQHMQMSSGVLYRG